MPAEPLDILPLWGVFVVSCLLLWLAMESGYRIGKWRHSRFLDEKDQPVGAMVASILALVGLVLGFTFSLAASRFDGRRLVILEEANAVGTAYLRTRLLPEPQRSESARLLRQYVEARVRGIQDRQPERAIAESETLHELLWAQATAAAETNPGSIMIGLYIESLNDVIDMHAKRVLVGLRSRIPVVIWMGLYGLAVLGMSAVGYQAALSATRRSPAMLVFVVAFAIVLYLIADLDRGIEGMLRVNQGAMTDLQKSMRVQQP